MINANRTDLWKQDIIASVETKRQQEQDRLDLQMGLKERNRLGQFATPPNLARDIAEYAWRLLAKEGDSIRFLEPCVGTGSFYSALRQVANRGRFECAVGYEIDPGHAEVARALWSAAGLQVLEGDFTQHEPPTRPFNLLITNPPYVRHHHLDREDKVRLQELVLKKLGIKVSGLAGLYCYMLLLAHEWLAEAGLSVWLIPSEFMDVNYGTAVKQYLTERVTLLHIHRYCPADLQFADALVSSAVVVFQKSVPAAGHAASFSLGGPLLEPGRQVTLPLSSLRVRDKWTKYPTENRTGGGGGGESKQWALEDLFIVKRGLATGDNRFFILPRQEAASLGIPEQFLKPILPSPRFLPDTIIEGDPDGYPRIDRQLGLIDCALPEDELRRYHRDFWAYLQSGMRRKVHEGYLACRRSPWYCQEERPSSPFLCTYMGRSSKDRKPFRFFWNKSRATAHNVYLLLYPRGAMKEALEADPELNAAVFAALQAIDTMHFIGEGRVYGGGLYKMEPKELGRISAHPLMEIVGDALRRRPSSGLFGEVDLHRVKARASAARLSR